MQAEYIAKITGDTSGLEKAVQKANGMVKKLDEDEVLIKLNYDGNVKGFNQEFSKILKACPELTIQFQYNANQKLLDKEIDKLKQLKDLKVDVETGNADKKISDMISSLESAVKNNAGSEIIEAKIKGIYKYANSIRDLGGKIKTNLEDGIYDAVSGSKYEKSFEKLLGNIDTDKIKLFNFKKPIDEEISASEKRIEEFQRFLTELESKGASKTGLSSELDNVREEIKILQSDLSDMKAELGNISGEKFDILAEAIKEVNIQLQDALDKIATLSGKNTLGDVIKKWQTQDITKTNERYTAFNSKNMQTAGVHAAADATGVSEELIRDSIEEMAGEADGFIHSHPEKYAAFSNKDIESFFTLFSEGITKQIVTSFDQALSLDLSKINMDYKDEIIQKINTRFDEIENIEIYENNISQYLDDLYNGIEVAMSSATANKLPDDIANNFKKNYKAFLDSVESDFTADDLFNGIESAIKSTLKESSSYGSASAELQKNIRQNLTGLTPMLLDSVNTYLKNAQQLGFQKELLSIFSDSKYLKEGVESAIQLQDVSDFIRDAEIAGNKIGDALVDGVRQGIDAHSDSQEGVKIADDFVNGVVHEIDDRIPDVEAAGDRLGNALVGAVKNVTDGDKAKRNIQDVSNSMSQISNQNNLLSGTATPSQQFDNTIQKDIVYLENYKNTIEEINQLKLQPQTDETEKKLEELQKLADYFFGSISITRNQLGNDGGRFSSDFYGTYRNRLSSEGYGDYAKEIFKIGKQLGSSLDINHLSDSFVGIEEEISRIESKSESLRQTFAKDLTESRNYVNKLRTAIMNMGFENEFLDKDSVEMFNEILSKYPELAKFKDTFASGGQAKDFLYSNEWNDFLATLPQAHAYLESIGYDFEKISQKTDVANNINKQSNALQRLEEENETLQQQAQITTVAEEELGDALDYWSKADSTTAIDAQISATQRLEEENENLRRSYQELENRYNDSQSDLRGEEEYSHSLYSDWQEEKQKLIVEQELTAELQKQNEELKERNKALEAGQQPDTGITSEFKDEQQVVDGVANSEATALSQLHDAINLVIDAVNEKTVAFEKEGAIVNQVIMNEELTALDVLSGYLVGLKRDIDVVAESFKGIKLDVNMANTDTNAIDKFVKSLSKIKDDKISDNLIKVFVQLDDFAQAVNKIKIDDKNILASINNLLNKSKELDNLASILKESKKKIQEATKATEEKKQPKEKKPKNYSEIYNEKLSSTLASIEFDINKYEKEGKQKRTSEYVQKLKDLQEQLELLQKKELDFVSQDDYKELLKFIDAIKLVKKEASFAENKAANEKSVQKYLGQINELLSKNTSRKFKKTEVYQELVDLQSLLASFDTSKPQAELDELGQKVLETITKFKGLDDSVKGGGFLKNFTHRLADMNAKFFAQYFSFQDMIRYAREAFTVIQDLNAQMVELAKVSEQSLKQIENDFNSYADVAKDLGATINDTISATADWARMGYNVSDSKQLAEVALLYKNVGDGIDITSANQSLISTLQGYQMQADQAEHIVDVFNEVANNYAIDTAGIGEALQRSAASLNAANTSLEESVALVTAANTVVQNPESVGTTFKTLSARIRGASTELQDLGEEEDEFTQTTSKLQNLVKSLTGFDILEADQKTFKSIYDILIGIGKEWKNLSDIEQASLGEALAGKRNANTLFAILDNIDTLESAYETAENAAGSARREQENFEQGLEYSINKAKAALQELAFDAVNSDFLKGLIDTGTKAIELIDKLIDEFGLLQTVIVGIGTIWGSQKLGLFDFKNGGIFGTTGLGALINGVRNNNTSKKDAQYINDIIKQVNSGVLIPENMRNYVNRETTKEKLGVSDDAIESVIRIGEQYKTAGEQVDALKTKVGGLGGIGSKAIGVFKSLGATLLNGLASVGLSLALSTLISIFDKIINKLHITKKEAAEAAASFKESFHSMIEDQNKNAKVIADLEEEFKELSKGVDTLGRNVGLTEEQFNRYHEITQIIADNIPNLISGYDAQGNAIIKLKGNVESLSEAYEKASIAQANQNYYAEDENGTRITKAAYKDVNNFFSQRYLEIGTDRQLDFKEVRETYQRLAEMDYNDAMKLVDDYSNYLEQTLFQNAGIYSNMSEEEFNTKAHYELLKQYNDFESELVSQNQTLADLASDYSHTIPDYWDKSLDSAREYFDYVLNNFDYDLAIRLHLVDEDGKVDEKSVNTLINKAITDFQGLDDKQIKAIDTRFSITTKFNNDEVSYGEYIQALKDAQNVITNIDSDEVRTMLRFIYDFQLEENKTKGLEDWLIALTGHTPDDNFLNNLTSSDIEKIFNIKIRYTDEVDNAKITQAIINSDAKWFEKPFMVKTQFKTDPYSYDEIKKELESNINPIKIEPEIKASDAVDSMAKAKEAITSLNDLYEQTVQNNLALKKDKKYLGEDGEITKQYDDQNMAVGFADPALINSVEQAFSAFVVEAKKAGKDVNQLNLALEEFNKTLVEQPGDAEAAQKAIDNLITAYIDQTDIIQKLDESNKEWSIAQLEAYGVTNAEEVVLSRLNKTVKETQKRIAALSNTILQNADALKESNKGTQSYSDAINAMIPDVNAALQVYNENGEPIDIGINVDSSFIEQHMADIQAMAAGDIDALNRVRLAAAQDAVMKVSINIPSDVAEQQISGLMDMVAQADAMNIDVGASIDDTDFIAALNAMIKSAGLTVDQVNAAFSAMGYEAKWKSNRTIMRVPNGAHVTTIYDGPNKGQAVHWDFKEEGVDFPSLEIITKKGNTGSGVGAHYGGSSGGSSGGGGGGGGGGGSDNTKEPNKPKEEAEESFDWIEVAIKRIEEEIARLDKVVGNSYDLWTHRNSALLKELEKTKEEIKAQQIAQSEYLRNANAVKVNNGKGLNPDDYGENDELVKAADQKLLDAAKKAWATGEYQKKVREGLMTGDDIEKIQNHFLADAIKEYQEL